MLVNAFCYAAAIEALRRADIVYRYFLFSCWVDSGIENSFATGFSNVVFNFGVYGYSNGDRGHL